MAAINPLGGGQPLGLTNNNQTARTAVRIEITTPRPTAEQLADAVFTTLRISERDRAAMRQANGGKDVRDALAADFRKNGINHTPLTYTGGGKYAGQVGMPTEMHRRLTEWAQTDGDAPAEGVPGAASKRGEGQAQGAYARHKAELALRKQEAYQQVAEGVLGKDGTQVAAGTVLALPKPTIPPAVVATGGALATAVVADKVLELGIERQMGAVRSAPPISMSKGQDEPPPTTTAEKPHAQPEIKVAPEGGELVKPDAAPPATTSQPTSTQPAAPQPGKPQDEPPAPKPPLDPARGIPTAITTAALGNLAADKAQDAEGTEVPQGLTGAQFEQLSARVREGAGHYGSDIRVHGSRAAGTARPDSDIDIAIRVSPERFDQIIREQFGTLNPGSAAERTMQHAIKTGKIQSGETGLKPLRLALEAEFKTKVDISVIREDGPFDQGPWIPIR